LSVPIEEREVHAHHNRTGAEPQMLIAILISLGIALFLLLSLRPDRKGKLIAHTPYNNHHNDASAAREDYLG